MKLNKNLFLKLFILALIILGPVVILLHYSKEHTLVEQNKILSPQYIHYFKNRYTILYVGYTGCINICTPRLKEISEIQRVLNDRGAKIEYMFLDLRELGDDVSGDFLKAFRGDFKILSLEENSKNHFLQQLGFYYARGLYDKNEFEHSSYLYLIENNGKELKLITTIMQYPFLNDTTIDYLEKKVKE